MSDLIEGRHPVLESLKAKRPINKIFLARGLGQHSVIAQILHLSKQQGVVVEYVDRAALDRVSLTRTHQGVVAFAAAHKYVEVEDILAKAHAQGEPPFILLLDGIEDPHNLGAIIRTADAAGVHGVVIMKHRAVGLTAVVAKTSAGAVEHVPVARVTNLNDCIRKLKEQRIWVMGLDEKGELELTRADFKLPLALVIGGEGKGLSRLVRENCDFLVRIDMRGKINSLNASVAAAVVMYEVVRQRKS
jgi:23S rRNA (guanosine2251-2'-O)-methyltransferase